MTADQIWQDVAKIAASSNFKKSDLVFGILQDRTGSSGLLVVKDMFNQVVGQIEYSIWNREYKMWAGNDLYRIAFPLTRRKTATLKRDADNSVLASYELINYLGKHKFEIFGYGTLVSERPHFSWHFLFKYYIGNTFVGLKKEISATRKIGKLALLPSNLPLPIRMFILLL